MRLWPDLARFLSLPLLASCGGGDSSTAAVSSAWQHVGAVPGVTGRYTPVVVMGANSIRVFGNTEDGRWGYRDGTWLGVGGWTEVVANPAGPQHFVRTSGVFCGPDGSCHALLHVGPCYGTGCVAGFVPQIYHFDAGEQAWRADGDTHTPFGIYQSSAANLVIGDTGCQAWEDGTGVKLVMMRAPLPCTQWSSDGKDMWPTDGSPEFCSAAKTPLAYHMICADGFPAKRHIWICSKDALSWRVVEANAGTKSGDKGTNLVWDGQLLHALSDGQHFTTTDRACDA